MTEDSGSLVTALALDSDGSNLAAAVGDGMVKWWSKERDVPLELKHPTKVNTLTFSPDGCWLVTGCHDGLVRIWEAASGKQIQEHGLTAPVGVLTFCPTNATLAAGWCYYGDLWQETMLSMEKDASLRPLNTVEHPLRDVGHSIGSSGFGGQAFLPEGKHLLTWNAMDREMRCWSVNDGTQEIIPLLHAGPVGGAAFRGNDEILTGASDGFLRVWKWSSPADPVSHALPKGFWIEGQWIAPSQIWVGIARGAEDEGVLVVAKRSTEKWTTRQIALPDVAVALALTPTADSALLGLIGGGLVRVDLADGTIRKLAGWDEAQRLPGHDLTVATCAYSANGHNFATADYEGHIRAWSVERNPKVLFSGRRDGEVTTLTFNNDGTTLASGGRDDRVNCWAVDRNGELLSSIKTPSWVERLEFLIDQRHVLVAMLGGRLGILDSWTGRWVMDVVSMGEDVISCGWTPEGIWGVQRQGLLYDWKFRPEGSAGLSRLGEILSRAGSLRVKASREKPVCAACRRLFGSAPYRTPF